MPAVPGAERCRAVVVGGGTGAPVSIRALLSLGLQTSTVVAMADNGGSTGILRQLPGITAPGDVRKCLVAMADDRDECIARRANIFRMRLTTPGNHVLGNLILGGFERQLGSFPLAIDQCEALLGARGNVLPSTLDAVSLAGIDVRGHTVDGQAQISHAREPMAHVFLQGDKGVQAYEPALEALKHADLIVLGPGSLFTSIVPNLLVPGIAGAIQESDATVVFVCPLADAQGETRGMNLADYVHSLERHGLEGRVNAVIINRPCFGNGARTYLAHDRSLNRNVYSVAYDDAMLTDLEREGFIPFVRPLSDADHVTWHDPVRLREVLLEVIEACHLLPR